MNVSVLILTHNESLNIGRCLAALDWCQDILVVDSGSSDDTLEIAEKYGARTLHRPFDDFASQRNYGLDHGTFRNEWVLHLDADEVVTPQFVRVLASLSPPAGIDAYYVPSKMMLFGQWLAHAGMYPSYQVRLGHRDRLRFVRVGHGQRENLAGERLAVFPEPYFHYSFSHGMRRWLEKHIRYAKDEAELLVTQRGAGNHPASGRGGPTAWRRTLKFWASHLPLFLRPLARFVYVYVLRRGFLDGRAGLAYAVMLSVYEGMISVLAYERLLGERSMIDGPQRGASSPK